jgi:hypothetical protein
VIQSSGARPSPELLVGALLRNGNLSDVIREAPDDPVSPTAVGEPIGLR